MYMKARTMVVGAAAALTAFVAPVLAQDDPDIQMEGERTLEFVPKDVVGIVHQIEIPDWSSAQIERIGSMLVGSWKSNDAIGQRDDTGESVHVWMHIAKTHIEGLDDVLYLEAHRDDAGDRPYRQSFLQIFNTTGGFGLRTLEPMRMETGLDPFAGFWAIPNQFPLYNVDQVLATTNIVLTDNGSMFQGKTPHRYPTALFGAVEMESEIRFDGTRLAVADRGFGPEGEKVWGPDRDTWIGFSRDTYPLHVEQSETGLTILTYPSELGVAPVDGQAVRFAYDGWLFDSGRLFSSSDRDGTLPEIAWPLKPNTMNWAWEEVIAGARLGMVKRFISPHERAYRLRGMPALGVPPKARIVFHMECVAVEDPKPAQPETAQGSTG